MAHRTGAESKAGRDRPNTWRPWIVGVGAAVLIVATAVILMNIAGLFQIPDDDTGAKTIAAALALVGTALTASVTLIGTVVKYSIDDRNARLAMEAEQRNRIEAAIRAVDLLSENNKHTTDHQMGGALLALTSLGEHDLAIALLDDLWSSGLVPRTVADVVLSRALEEGSENAMVSASTTLFYQAEQIQHTDSNMWPTDVLDWRHDRPLACRRGLILAACRWATSELKKNPLIFPSGGGVLFGALRNVHEDLEIRQIAAAGLKPLVENTSSATPFNFDGTRIVAGTIKTLVDSIDMTIDNGWSTQIEDEIRQVLKEAAEAEGEVIAPQPEQS